MFVHTITQKAVDDRFVYSDQICHNDTTRNKEGPVWVKFTHPLKGLHNRG